MILLTHQNTSDLACATFSRAGGDIDAIKRRPSQGEDKNGPQRQQPDGKQAAAAIPRKRMRSDGQHDAIAVG
jgi:hypothetical protein